MASRALDAAFGGGGHPSGGHVALQVNLCASVPGWAKHNWQRGSTMPNEGTDAFLSSPSCANGAACQVVVFGAGFDTRSIRYQREGLRFFEVDLPDTIEAKRVVHERYRDEFEERFREAIPDLTP